MMEKGPYFDEIAAISDRRATSTSSSSDGVRLLDLLARLFGAPPEGKRESDAEPMFTWGSLEVRRLLGRGSFGEVCTARTCWTDVPERGRVLIFFGGPHGPSRVPDWQALGPVSYSLFGYYVVGVGDVDGDGFNDIAISAPQYTDGKRIHLGMVEVYRGGKHGCETRAAWRVVGDTTDCYLGFSVVGGDLNGDHVPDLVICTPYWGDREPECGRILAFLGQHRK